MKIDCEPLPTFTSSPCTIDGIDGHWSGEWMVWDMRAPLPPKPVFTGTIEDCGLVAGALNRRQPRPPTSSSEDCSNLLARP